MNILVLGMNYKPELTAIGPLTADMCESLGKRSHKVTMLTAFPHYPEWRIFEGYRGKLLSRETLSGVQVRRGFVCLPGSKPKPFRRILYDTSIAISAGVNLVGCRRPEVIVVVSPPLQLVLLSLLARRLWNAPTLLVIQDIVPDVAINLGMLSNRIMVRLAMRLERFCYDHVDSISVIGRGFLSNLIGKHVPSEKISIIPNWVDLEVVKPLDRMNRFRRKHAIDPDTFVVLYGGNMGQKQGLENIIRAAEEFRRQQEVHFYLVGQGVARDDLVGMAQERSLHNITFLPFEPEEMLPDMLAAADVLLLTQRSDVREAVLPSKFLKYIATGRPVIAAVNGESETALYVREAQCGKVIPPENPAALAMAIRALHRDGAMRLRMGVNGRRFAESNIGRGQALQRYAELIEALAHSQAS